MKAIIIYCSKTKNTEKVANSIQQGLQGTAEMVKLDLNTEGLLQKFSPSFTLNLLEYDLIFFGGWTMVMKVHPFLAAYIQKCENLEGKNVVGFLTGGAIFSRGHVRDDFTKLIESRGARVFDFLFVTTLLGATLTKKKLRNAEKFAGDIMSRYKEQE